ncbi:hypothetical protein FM038_021520 [Shewanella eurypsychrophilus]|uniref:Uncharacterized protein n=1 Tax=Shewanella eurypsychrophilus TaxID=2593656 RepID=A0ABX6VCN8_9GAMM|nr:MULTISPECIES: hypothetical protein [Shewanella]QFU24468.1 hypothetical protein FS418_23215 [Shewanella sp. YLB-09]QPG59668.1 hypothetical protein FM038_021520 [Shewanella eurypsychrophilus]
MTPEYRIDVEQRIESYLAGNDVNGIKYMQVEQTFDELGIEIYVWNIKTNDGNWWVVEGEAVPMNLYTQNEFYFSADEAYSFHLGITQRRQAQHHQDFKHVIDEVPLDIEHIKSISRRLNNAALELNNVSGPEDIQSIGLTCRESLIELAGVLAQDNPDILKESDLKTADFKGISKAVISLYAPGKSNSKLRKRCRDLVEGAWDHSSEVVHSPNKNIPDAKICLLFTCSAVSVIQNLFLKYLGFDDEPKCPECKSMDYELFAHDNTEKMVLSCNACGHKEMTAEKI